MIQCWVNTYGPLASHPGGVWEKWRPSIPRFADASCRREPDLESRFPTITGLCRPPSVRRFKKGDLIAYFAKKHSCYDQPGHRLMTAVLRVLETFESHQDAGDWYKKQFMPLPQNLMLPDNPPLPLGMTEGKQNYKNLREWDLFYLKRAKRCSDVCVCEVIVKNLNHGINVDINNIFKGKFPNTQSPRKISTEIMAALIKEV